MTHTGKMVLLTWASLTVCTVVHGITPESSSANPYQGIVDRNVFALKPPPPPPPAVDNTKQTGPKIILTGITTILGKRALMKATLPVQNEPGKPPTAPKEESFMLKEGERQGEIEVLEINDKAGTVKVNNYGVVMTLDFEKDGAKTPFGPAIAVSSGVPVQGGAIVPGGGVAPNTLPLGVPPKTGFNPSIPTRTLRLPNQSYNPGGVAPGGVTPVQSPNSGAATSLPGFSGTTSLSAGAPASDVVIGPNGRSGSQANYPPEERLTPEEQKALMLLHQEASDRVLPFPVSGGGANPATGTSSGPPALPLPHRF